ncbi:unnamed protein product, partial [Meganyctiphanes norvegica]
MEETECIVCFSRYDDEEHRPRSLPCGHAMCSDCLETAIKEQSKKCPKCRKLYSASNVNDISINYPLEGVIKLLNISKGTKSNDLPECPEHQLQLSHRCTTHRAWICQGCLKEDHSSESCKIIKVSDELSIKKSTQLDQTKPTVNGFEETCKKADDSRNQCKEQINICNEDIIRYETMIKQLQEGIQRKQNSRTQMQKTLETFDQKLDNLKCKKRFYDQAVTILNSSETIRSVSQSSVEVQNETKKLELISQEIIKEVELMTFVRYELLLYFIGLKMWPELICTSFSLQNTFHIFPNTYLKSDKKGIDDNAPPLPEGLLTFLDFARPDEAPRRVYMKMLGNTARARQHLILVSGQQGKSYRGVKFSGLTAAGQPGESLEIQPYDGNKAMPLLKDVTVTDVVKNEIKAGLVTGYGFSDKYNKGNNAMFSVFLKGNPGYTCKSAFAQVTSGLEILKEIAKSNERENIKVVDCGVVLYWP